MQPKREEPFRCGLQDVILTARGLVVVHVDALQLQVGVTVVGTGGIDTVLIAHDLMKWKKELDKR